MGGESGGHPQENLKIVVPEKQFLSLFLGRNFSFQLDFESQIDILYEIFYIKLVLWLVYKVKRKATKYLINDCGASWIMRECVLVYGLQTTLYFVQGESWDKSNGPRVTCASAETVQTPRSQTP